MKFITESFVKHNGRIAIKLTLSGYIGVHGGEKLKNVEVAPKVLVWVKSRVA